MERWQKRKIFEIFNKISIGIIILIGLWFIYTHICPLSCDDGDRCTDDFCSAGTNYQCQHAFIVNCCGNNKCEPEENYENCPQDCPNCDDLNKCTQDSFDYQKEECINSVIECCCGNRLCEAKEDYKEDHENCPQDCPNCDDSNSCTNEWWDYENQDCRYEIIRNCCGNKICEVPEDKNNCPKDCLINSNEYIEVWLAFQSKGYNQGYDLYGFRNCFSDKIIITDFVSYFDDRKEFEFTKPKTYPSQSCHDRLGYVLEDKAGGWKEVGVSFKGNFNLRLIYKGSIFSYESYDRYDGRVIGEKQDPKSNAEIFIIKKDDLKFIARLDE